MAMFYTVVYIFPVVFCVTLKCCVCTFNNNNNNKHIRKAPQGRNLRGAECVIEMNNSTHNLVGGSRPISIQTEMQ